MTAFISLTKKDIEEILKGKNIEVTIDGEPRVYVKHCDCKICKDFSKEFHAIFGEEHKDCSFKEE